MWGSRILRDHRFKTTLISLGNQNITTVESHEYLGFIFHALGALFLNNKMVDLSFQSYTILYKKMHK